MSKNKILPTVSSSDIASKGVQALADRPNRTNHYGASGLNAKQLKEWFDKLVVFLAEKINFISDALDGETIEKVNEENVKIPAGRYIKISAGGYTNLFDLIEAMEGGEFASNVLKLYPDAASARNKDEKYLMSLQACMNTIAADISQNTEALGDLNALVGDKNKLPEGLTEKTVIAYIESVAGALANKSAVKVNGVVKSEWDATETLKSYVLKTALEKTLESYTAQSDFVALKNTVDNFFSDDAAINDTIDTLKEIANYIASDESGAADITKRVGALEGDIADKLDAKFEAIDDNKIRFVVAYPDGSIKAEKIATGGSY